MSSQLLASGYNFLSGPNSTCTSSSQLGTEPLKLSIHKAGQSALLLGSLQSEPVSDHTEMVCTWWCVCVCLWCVVHVCMWFVYGLYGVCMYVHVCGMCACVCVCMFGVHEIAGAHMGVYVHCAYLCIHIEHACEGQRLTSVVVLPTRGLQESSSLLPTSGITRFNTTL